MTTATKEAPHVAVGHNDRAWFDLEEPIREVTFMARIVHDLAYELLDLELTRARKGDGENEIITMSKRECEQFFFAISDVHDRAEALEKLYHAK
jgi:hypothetical protein